MDIFSNLQVAGECLLDKARTENFRKAIEREVKIGDIVLDGGTGSGILALFAARAGAKKVYAVEVAPDLYEMAIRNVRANSYENVIDVINADMKELNIPDQIDVFVCEMLDTGLIAEQQCQAVNNLHNRGVISSNTKVIPGKVFAYLEIVNYDFSFYGFDMPFIIQARNFGVIQKIKKKFTKPQLYSTFDFSSVSSTEVQSRLKSRVSNSGKANAVVLTTSIELFENNLLSGTTDMNMPVIIPIEEVSVSRGQVLDLSISYKCGLGFNQVKIDIRP